MADKKETQTRILVWLFATVILLALLFILSKHANSSLNNLIAANYANFDNSIPTENEKRQPIMNDSFSAAKWIAGEDEEARNILTSLKSAAYLVEPVLGYEKNFLPLKSEKKIGILPFISEDSANISWQEEFSSEKIVDYNEIDGIPIIILGNNSATKISQGLALLQIGFLVLNKNKMTMGKAYVKALEMSFRLLHNKFDKAYEEIVQEEIASFKFYGDFIPELSSVRLEEIYGKTLSENERTFQYGLLYIEVAFRIIDEECFSNKILADQTKIKILSCGD